MPFAKSVNTSRTQNSERNASESRRHEKSVDIEQVNESKKNERNEKRDTIKSEMLPEKAVRSD